MPVFEYIAIDASGRTKKGMLTADGLGAARRKLRAQSLFPTTLTQSSVSEDTLEKKKPTRSPRIPRFFKKIGRAELSGATRQIATLLGAGLPLDKTLSILLEQTKTPALYSVFAQVMERIKEGKSLAAALAEHPSVFSSTYVTMISASESSGTLELVMDRLADFMEAQLELERKIKATLAYPILMLLVGTAVVFLLMIYVIPRVTSIFTGLHQELPAPTRILITISSFVGAYWPWIIGGAIALWFTFNRLLKTQIGRTVRDRLLLRLPVTGTIVRNMAAARFCKTLGTIHGHGVPLLEALGIVSKVVGNSLLEQAIDTVGRDVSEGRGLAGPLAQSRIFPPIVIQMISAGEQSGRLDEMLLKVADLLEREATTRLTVVSSLFEPIMILVLGLVVGFMVLAVLLPIFEMSSLIH